MYPLFFVLFHTHTHKLSVVSGTFSVWDLRNFQSSVDTTPKPLARFTCHRQPITSLEWHPTDESTIVVTDEDGTYVYDLSVEEDEEDVVGDEYPYWMIFLIVDHIPSDEERDVGKDG